MTKRKYVTFLLVAGLALFKTQASAQEVQKISEYLSKLNYAYVSFEGEINYDEREDAFRLSIEGEWFGAVLDAGRETRERVQKSCAGKGAFDMKWCVIAGEGTVEVRGADIWVSVEKISKLE